MVQAAHTDIRRRQRWLEGDPPEENYAFLRRHVVGAQSALDLLGRALQAVNRKDERLKVALEKTTKRQMWRLYVKDLLEAAIELEKA